MGLPVAAAARSSENAAASLVLQTWFHRVSFLLTGIFTTIVNQLIFYHGVGDPATGFLSLPTYLGMLMVLVMPVSRTPCSVSQWKFAGMASVDVFSAVLCILGLQVIGSGVYQVLYSSVVCFTAFFSTCFLRKSHSLLQWLGILAIAGGLALTSHDSVPDHPEHGTTFVAGILVTLVGCVGYACSYVLNEAMLGRGGDIVPQRQCVLVGAYGTLLHLVYFLVFIAPHWETKVVNKVLASGTSGTSSVTELCTVVLYAALIY
jgi:drug/metabolite transporter (DMT)-like permease